MIIERVLFFGLLGAALAAGCGGNVILDSGGSGGTSTGPGGAGVTSMGTAGGSGFSCDFTMSGVHQCALYENLPAADVQAEEGACSAEGGTSGTSCSDAGRLGTCSETAGGFTYSVSFYADAGLTAAVAQQACAASAGTWTAG
jgi:hypothetical protein